MSSINRVILLGRLGADPKLSHLPSGSAVAEFPLATDDSYTDRSGNKQTKTEWHKIKVWGRQAQPCADYLAKGKQVLVEGKITTEKWTDREGQERSKTIITATHVLFLGDKASRAQDPESTRQSATSGGMDDVPF